MEATQLAALIICIDSFYNKDVGQQKPLYWHQILSNLHEGNPCQYSI